MSADINIVVVTHGIDMVLRETFRSIGANPGFNVIFAGPDEDEEHGYRIDAIKSKITPKAIFSLRSLFKRFRPDIVYAISTSALSNVILASRGMPDIKIVGYRGTQAKVRKSDPFNYLALLNPKVSHIVCETEDIKEYLSGNVGAGKVSFASKPFELKWVEDALRQPFIDPNAKHNEGLRLVTIGHFKGRPHKGLKYLIDAVKILNEKGVKTVVSVIGAVDEADIKISPENIRFLGWRSDAVNFLAGQDIYILPSTRDASPRTLREAQACGVPCIVSDIPGARDLIIPDKTGILTKAADPQGIADAVISLNDNRIKLQEMSEACRRHIEDDFSLGKYVDYFSDLFKNLVNSQK